MTKYCSNCSRSTLNPHRGKCPYCGASLIKPVYLYTKQKKMIFRWKKEEGIIGYFCLYHNYLYHIKINESNLEVVLRRKKYANKKWHDYPDMRKRGAGRPETLLELQRLVTENATYNFNKQAFEKA